MRWLKLLLVLALSLGFSSCAPEPMTVTLEAVRQQPPLVRLARPVSVGILLVYADDELLEATRPDLWNVSGLVVKGVRDSFATLGGQVEVVDYTHLGFRMWERERSKAERVLDPQGWTLDAWPGVPPEVTTSLVTVVKVLRWDVGPVHPDGRDSGVNLTLLMSTWTREGQPVNTEILSANGRVGGPFQLTSNEAAVELHEELKPPRRVLPGEWTEAFWALLQELVGLHYFLLLPHQVPERLELVGTAGDEGVRACEEKRYADALEVWRRRYETDPRDHRALYNAARLSSLLGDDTRALQLLSAARAVEDVALYQEARERVQRRVARSWTPGASRPRARSLGAQAQEGSSPTQCFSIEHGQTRDPRWLRGLALDIQEEVLRDYHPERCGWPGVRCALDSYQVKWAVGIWSERFLPGQNDLDRKPNLDGTRRRMWSYFYDHSYRYRYCVYREEG
jgi:tetratricopeptide (TPR) repeat protein